MVELNDKVEVLSEGTVKKYLIPSDLTNIPIIPRNCLGKKVGDEFWINDKKYKILSIKKSITV